MVRLRCLIFPWILLCAALPLGAQQYLFVFHAGTQATVYDLDTFEPLASPMVGGGAVRAIGVPSQATPSSFSKIYVLGSDSVVVLNPQPPFATRASLELRAPITLGERSAVLTQDSKSLIVAAGRFVHVFDTTDAANPAPVSIDLGGEITSITALPNSERAYATVQDSERIEIISLNSMPPARLAGPITLEEVPATVAAAPNASALYAAAAGLFFEIDPIENTLTRQIEGIDGVPLTIGFDPESPVATAFVRHDVKLTAFDLLRRERGVEFSGASALTEALSPGGSLVYFFTAATGEIYLGDLSNGSFARLVNPTTQSPFERPGIDIEIDPSNQDVFLALGGESGRLVRLNATATILRNQIVPLALPTKLSAIAPPGTFAAAVEVYGGNNQLATVGEVLPKPLVVRAIDTNLRPAANQSVEFSTLTPNVVFRPPSATTNHAGIAQTRVTVPITNPFTIQARLLPADLTATFDVNTALPQEEGLNIVSGNYQVTAGGTEFPRPFRVLATTGGKPIPNLVMTITPTNFAGTCPPTTMTGADGMAVFTCSASVVAAPVLTMIQVADTFGRSLPEPFQVTTVTDADRLPRVAQLNSPIPVVGQVNTTVADAIIIRIAERLSGFPMANVGVEFATPGDVRVTPTVAVSDGEGIARANITFGCELETSQVVATLSATGLPTAVIPYSSVRGSATQVSRLGGNNQSGNSGDRLPLALLARASDVCGNVVPAAPLTWTVNPPQAATLENAFAQTNAVGEGSAQVRIGARPGPFTVEVSTGGSSAFFTLTAIASGVRVVAVSGDNQSVPIGQTAAQPLVVELQTSAGAPIANTQVDFQIIAGAGGLDNANPTTDESGRASTIVTAGPQAGPLQVEARSGDSTFVFTVNVIGRTPLVTSAGFVNGASFATGWTPGSTASIFGVGLMEGVDGVVAPPAPFPTTLRGVRVLVENVPAPILSMANVNGQEQINIQVPFGISSAGMAVVTIINNGASASFSNVAIGPLQPGIFEVTLPSGKFGAALHADYSLVEPDNPARPGEIIQLYWTGGGATNPPVATNEAGPLTPALVAAEVEVVAGGETAENFGSFYAPTLVTVYQTNLRIPLGASGTTVTIKLVVGGVESPEVTIPLGP